MVKVNLKKFAVFAKAKASGQRCRLPAGPGYGGESGGGDGLGELPARDYEKSARRQRACHGSPWASDVQPPGSIDLHDEWSAEPGRLSPVGVSRSVVDQSSEATSPPAGVTAPQNTEGSTAGETVRTLPSNRAISIPPACGVWGTLGSHSFSRGLTWNVLPGSDGSVRGGKPVVTGYTSGRIGISRSAIVDRRNVGIIDGPSMNKKYVSRQAP